MRKFIVTLCILIILAAGVFMLGWAQFSVPPGGYGVVRSKTHGVDPAPVRSGEFRWIWYKLIPTNVAIAVFRLEQTDHRFSIQNSLPSGNSYAAFAGVSPADFSWEISAILGFSINPDKLVQLVSDANIGSQEELAAYQKELAEKIEGLVLRRITGSGFEAGQLENLLKTGASPELEQEIAGQFPVIQDVSLLVKSARFPDFALYSRIRQLYEDFTAQQREYVATALKGQAETRIDTQLRFGELERYGELLAKYPVLLQYLALERGIGDSKRGEP
jgi:hypothetical protein